MPLIRHFRLTESEPSATLYIFEPSVDGHHLLYVRAIADGVAGSYARVVWLTTADSASSDEARVHLGDLIATGRLTTLIVPEVSTGGARQRLAQWSSIRRVVRSGVLVVPDGDRVFSWWTLLGRSAVPAHFLLMRPPNPDVNGMARKFRHEIKAGLLTLGALRPHVYFHPLVSREGSGITSRRWSTPARDPVFTSGVTRSAAREHFGISSGRVVCGVVGVLTERKGVAGLLDVWAELPSPRPLLLLAGKPDAPIDAALRGPVAQRLTADGDLHLVSGYLSNNDLDLAVAGLDLSLQLYDNSEGPSGIYAKAKDLGVPVLTYAGNTYLRLEIERLGNGLICDRLDSDSLLLAVTTALANLSSLTERAIMAQAALPAPTRFAEDLGLVEPALPLPEDVAA